jgi:hypothetical protein
MVLSQPVFPLALSESFRQRLFQSRGQIDLLFPGFFEQITVNTQISWFFRGGWIVESKHGGFSWVSYAQRICALADASNGITALSVIVGIPRLV